MQANKVKPVYSVIDPNTRKDTLEVLKSLAVEKLLQRIKLDHPQ